MLHGFIYHYSGIIELHCLWYPYHKFIGYTERQAKEQYRKIYGLKYKRIAWM